QSPTYVRIICYCSNTLPHTNIYALSLHDALPICDLLCCAPWLRDRARDVERRLREHAAPAASVARAREARAREDHGSGRAAESRSEEHTSELQSLAYLVCRLLLEKKKTVHVLAHL